MISLYSCVCVSVFVCWVCVCVYVCMFLLCFSQESMFGTTMLRCIIKQSYRSKTEPVEVLNLMNLKMETGVVINMCRR